MEEFNLDYKARKEIEYLLLRINAINQKLQNTKILLDHDNYHRALSFYRMVRYNAQEQQSFAIPIYEILKKYFGGRKSKKNTPKEDK